MIRNINYLIQRDKRIFGIETVTFNSNCFENWFVKGDSNLKDIRELDLKYVFAFLTIIGCNVIFLNINDLERLSEPVILILSKLIRIFFILVFLNMPLYMCFYMFSKYYLGYSWKTSTIHGSTVYMYIKINYEPKRKFYSNPYFYDLGKLIYKNGLALKNNNLEQTPNESTAFLPRLLKRLVDAVTYTTKGKQITILDFRKHDYEKDINLTIIKHLKYLWNYPLHKSPRLVWYNSDGFKIIPNEHKFYETANFSRRIYGPYVYPYSAFKCPWSRPLIELDGSDIDWSIPLLTDDDKVAIRDVITLDLQKIYPSEFAFTEAVRAIRQEVAWYKRDAIEFVLRFHCPTLLNNNREREANHLMRIYQFLEANKHYSSELMHTDRFPASTQGVIEYTRNFLIFNQSRRFLAAFDDYMERIRKNPIDYLQEPFINRERGYSTPMALLDDYDEKKKYYNDVAGVPQLYYDCYEYYRPPIGKLEEDLERMAEREANRDRLHEQQTQLLVNTITQATTNAINRANRPLMEAFVGQAADDYYRWRASMLLADVEVNYYDFVLVDKETIANIPGQPLEYFEADDPNNKYNVGMINYHLDYDKDPFDISKPYDYMMSRFHNMPPIVRQEWTEILNEKFVSSGAQAHMEAHFMKDWFENDKPTIDIPFTKTIKINGKEVIHGFPLEEWRLYHCNIKFPGIYNMKTQKFEWHGYLKLKKDRLYALQELGWQQNVIEECKSHLNECWSMEVDKIPADKALEHFSNITTRRIFFHPGVYKLTNNHYVPLHFTRNFELESISPERILEFKDYRWPEFLAWQLGYPTGTRLIISDKAAKLVYEADCAISAVRKNVGVLLQNYMNELYIEPNEKRPRPLEELCEEIRETLKTFSWDYKEPSNTNTQNEQK
ncbi:hypothetical protein ACTA71_004302 [Dictyostelium dimigraforme]